MTAFTYVPRLPSMLFALLFVTMIGGATSADEPSADEQSPSHSIGVGLGIFQGEIKADDQTFTQGLTVIGLDPGSPAEQAGLMIGDVIVAAEGADFTQPIDRLRSAFHNAVDATSVGETITLRIYRDNVERVATIDGEPTQQTEPWEDPRGFAFGQAPGTTLELKAARVRKVFEVRVPVVPSVAKPKDSVLKVSADIEHTAAEQWRQPAAEAATLERLVAQHDAKDDVAKLYANFERLATGGDIFRTRAVRHAFNKPWHTPAVARDFADTDELAATEPYSAAFAEVFGYLEQAARHQAVVEAEAAHLPIPIHLIGGPYNGKDPNTINVRAILVTHLRRAAEALEHALRDLDESERKFLRDHVATMAESFHNDIMLLRDPDRERLANVKRFVELSARVDRGALLRAAEYAAAGVAAVMDYGDFPDPQTIETEVGNIVIAGPGNDWHKEPAAVIIDLGGDDFYTAEAAGPFSIIIDLDGDDSYQATFDYAQGAALLGVSLLYDKAGHDRYIGQRFAQGVGILGVGMLIDEAGDDVYRAQDFSQAMSYCGAGILIDHTGNDRYEAPRFAQSLALPGGMSWLVDHAGSDSYYCKGRDLGAYGTPGIFAGWGQGCAVGFRGLASGGIAALVDRGGDDVYEAGNFSQGGGYYYGFGILRDLAGRDRYLGERYAQGFAAHQAIGFFEDLAGDDEYFVQRGVGQSCSWDQTITFFYDHDGDDMYSGGGFALAATAHNALGVLIDFAGLDTYAQHPGKARAHPNNYHHGGSLALLLDLGPQQDRYPNAAFNDTFIHDDRHGFFGDGHVDFATLESAAE